jgi:hypothetical protein
MAEEMREENITFCFLVGFLVGWLKGEVMGWFVTTDVASIDVRGELMAMMRTFPVFFRLPMD